MDYEAIAGQLLSEAKELKELKGKKLGVSELLPLAVKAAEAYAIGKSLSSADKKGIALAIIKQAAAAAPKTKELKALAAKIDLALLLANSIFGKSWFGKIK